MSVPVWLLATFPAAHALHTSLFVILLILSLSVWVRYLDGWEPVLFKLFFCQEEASLAKRGAIALEAGQRLQHHTGTRFDQNLKLITMRHLIFDRRLSGLVEVVKLVDLFGE